MNDIALSIDVGAIAYSAGAVANSVFAVLLLTSWKGRQKGGLLVLAVVLNVVWAVGLATLYRSGTASFWGVYTLEILRDAGWLIFLLSVLGVARIRQLIIPSFSLPFVVFSIIAFNVAICLTLSLISPMTFIAGEIGSLPLVGLLGMVLAGIILIEQIYRNTSTGNRWALKFLCVGLGAMFAYDIYLYANSLMFHQISPLYWDARGIISTIIVPMLAVSIARTPGFSINLFISRHVVFYSSAITAVGFYLLFIAAGGYYLREYGGTWGGFIQVVFLFGAAILLVLILLSSKARANFKIFFVKHFFSNKYDYRIEWLKLINTLSNTDEKENLQQRAIRSLVEIMSARGGGLWWLSGNGCFTLGAIQNMDPPEELSEPSGSEFVEYLKEKKWVLDITASELPDGFVMPAWLKELKEKDAWLLVPLINANFLFGFIVLEGRGKNPSLDWEDMDFLKTVGRQLTSYLALESAAEELSESRQFDAYNKLAAFVIHDIKNLVSQLSLLAQNAVTHMNNPLFVQDAMQTIENSVNKMNGLLAKLRQDHGDGSNQCEFDLEELLKDVVSECSTRVPAPKLQMTATPTRLFADRERLSMMMRHLISNSQDATSDDGQILIRVSQSENYACIKVEDDGCGMTPEFIRSRLFRPFDTTKSIKGMGIGAYEVKEYVNSVGGMIEVKSSPEVGTAITVKLPLGTMDMKKNVVAEESHSE